MKKILFQISMILLLIPILIGGCALTKEIVIKDYIGIAQKPIYTIGEKWVYRQNDSKGYYKSGVTIEYLGQEEKNGTIYHVFLNKDTGRKRYFTEDFHWAFSSEKDPIGPGWRDHEWFDPPEKLFEFPLQVGKSWRYDLVTSRITGDPPKPRTGRCVKERKVLDFVRIELKGKSYEAFKIEGKCQLHKTQQIFWYAPSVKNWVKRITHKPDGTWWQEELTNYISK